MQQSEVIEIVRGNSPLHYKKFGTFPFRVATKEETVVTSIDGEEETKNTANVGDFILEGLSGEKYVMGEKTFFKRYKMKSFTLSNGQGEAEAIGECWGIQYDGEPIVFDSPWPKPDGTPEQMICNPADYLVSPTDEFKSAYRIKHKEFIRTYKLVEDGQGS